MSSFTEIFVYAHWKGMNNPELIGSLFAHQSKGKKVFSFEYDKNWLNSKYQFLFDPEIQFFGGPQFSNQKENFGVFLDSLPDTWGRTLMKRRAFLNAKKSGERPKTLYEIDYLLGVYDKSRMGALRFKLDKNGEFLDHSDWNATPPWSSIGALQNAVYSFENEDTENNSWLSLLIAPGSSLGGARPKANILYTDKSLWIAKFPSKMDNFDKAAWEYLAHQMAKDAGIEMSECKLIKISGSHHTFLTKRFDRDFEQRIHFASAMTMTAHTEETIKNNPASYLDIAEFISNHGQNVTYNLNQLWRRIIFNIAISNTDDHLRNHGFILKNGGWELSPAYDINPSVDKEGLALNIDLQHNNLDFDLALSVGTYFRLHVNDMNRIINDVLSVTKNWRNYANKIGISKLEQVYMEQAFFHI